MIGSLGDVIFEVLIVAECNVNFSSNDLFSFARSVLIVAECNVNNIYNTLSILPYIVLIVAECNVNNASETFLDSSSAF